jgi:DNA-binding GntR family transcriptional regulator
MINALRDQIYQFRRIILEQKTMAQASNEDHRLMLDFIRKRDAEGAERLVRQHILKGQEAVLANFDRDPRGERSTS